MEKVLQLIKRQQMRKSKMKVRKKKIMMMRKMKQKLNQLR